jgi:hypothetical protein
VTQGARDAHRRREWQDARDGFRAAAERAPLSTDDMDAWADAAWWLGLVDESIRAGSEAYRLFLADGRPRRAATSAVGVAVNHFLRGEAAEGSGWVSRAQRLMAGEPESADQGFLRYLLEVEGALDGPDLDRVVATARELNALGRRLGDPNLAAAGVLGEGRALVRQGRRLRPVHRRDRPGARRGGGAGPDERDVRGARRRPASRVARVRRGVRVRHHPRPGGAGDRAAAGVRGATPGGVFFMLAEAGFLDTTVHDAPGDPLDLVYVTYKPDAPR